MSFTIKRTALNGASISVTIIKGPGANSIAGFPGAVNNVASKLGFKNTIGIEEIVWDFPEAQREAVRGMANRETGASFITGYTPPIHGEPSLSLKLWLSEYAAWSELYGHNYYAMTSDSFDVHLTYKTQISGPMMTIVFENCFIKKPASQVSTSQVDNILVDLPCYVTSIKINGKSTAVNLLNNTIVNNIIG